MVAVSPEGVEWSSESAVLSCSGDGWDSGNKEVGKEGDRDSLLMGTCTRGWQLLAQSQAQQGGQLVSPWGFSWVTGPWGGPLGYTAARGSDGHCKP